MTGDRSPLAQQARAQLEGQTPEQFAAYQQTYMRQFGVIDEAVASRLAVESGRSNPRATADFAAQLLLLDLRPRLGSIKVPVIEISPFNAPDFAAMGVDEAGKTNYYRMLLQGVEKLEVISVSPARHFVMFDQPEKFAAALDQALAKVVELTPARTSIEVAMPAGYSGTPLAKKLGLKPGDLVCLLDAPAGFRKLLDPVPEGVRFVTKFDKGAQHRAHVRNEEARARQDPGRLSQVSRPRCRHLGVVAEEGGESAHRHHRGRGARSGAAARTRRHQGVRGR